MTLVLALASLALTAYWFHHLQVLPPSRAHCRDPDLRGCDLGRRSRRCDRRAGMCRLRSLVGARERESPAAADDLGTAHGGSASSDALERARIRFYPHSSTVSYMVFGSNNENAHAVFISHRFDLACRWFHLYPYSPDDQLDETTACSRRERPMLILVTLGFWDSREGGSWRRFVSTPGSSSSRSTRSSSRSIQGFRSGSYGSRDLHRNRRRDRGLDGKAPGSDTAAASEPRRPALQRPPSPPCAYPLRLSR